MKACLNEDDNTNEKDGNKTNDASNGEDEEVEMKTNDGPSNCKLKASKHKTT